MGILDRLVKLEEITVELQSGLDGQGAPSYAAAQTIEARVVEEDAVGRTADGTEIRTTLTVWVPAGESPVPDHQTRITRAGGATFIVVERQQVEHLRSGAVHHTRLRCQDEGV